MQQRGGGREGRGRGGGRSEGRNEGRKTGRGIYTQNPSYTRSNKG